MSKTPRTQPQNFPEQCQLPLSLLPITLASGFVAKPFLNALMSAMVTKLQKPFATFDSGPVYAAARNAYTLYKEKFPPFARNRRGGIEGNQQLGVEWRIAVLVQGVYPRCGKVGVEGKRGNGQG